MQIENACGRCGEPGCYLRKCVFLPAPELGEGRIKLTHVEWRCETCWWIPSPEPEVNGM